MLTKPTLATSFADAGLATMTSDAVQAIATTSFFVSIFM